MPLLEAAGSTAASRLDPDLSYGICWYPREKITQSAPDRERGYARSRQAVQRPREEQVPIPVTDSGLDRETIDRARRALAENPTSRNTGGRVFQLAGLIYCAECGRRLISNTRTVRGKVYHHYRCGKRMRHGAASPTGCGRWKQYPAAKIESLVINAVLEAVKDKDELIRQAEERFAAERERLLRAGGTDAERWHRRLEALERQRMEHFRQSARGRLSDEQLDALLAEVDAEREHVERAMAEYEARAEKLSELEAALRENVRLIKDGAWTELGITAPEARRQRYREIGLKAVADAEGRILLTWGFGEKKLLSTTASNSRSRVPTTAFRCRDRRS